MCLEGGGLLAASSVAVGQADLGQGWGAMVAVVAAVAVANGGSSRFGWGMEAWRFTWSSLWI